MSVDESDNEATAERIATLGFQPQKEILVNTLLPYADQLDEESGRLFAQIKTNLGKSVMLREMKPACGVWTARLMKYIRIYGLKFSKEDHIGLVKLVYELILIPDLEPSKVHKFATLFVMLTKRRYLISPDELTLAWRPLFDLGINMFEKSRTDIGMYHYLAPLKGELSDPSIASDHSNQTPAFDMIKKFLSGTGIDDAINFYGFGKSGDIMSQDTSYLALVKCAKPYFAPSATQEILDECMPKILPWCTASNMLSQMIMFLPVSLHPKYAAQGHELWFEEMFTLWDTCANSLCGVADLMFLFSGFAERNPGAVDWTPYVPMMFSRFLHAIRLPVSYKDMQYSRCLSLDPKYIASWIVWTISPDGVILKQLRTFLTGIESYLHCANAGRWSFRLRDLLRTLSKEFVSRVRKERDKKFQNTWENPSPESFKLRDEDITEFVQIVLEPTLVAVHSRTGTIDVSFALQNLATLRPALVVPPLLEMLKTSLESLTEPHRVTAAMTAVVAVARPMLRGPLADYPEGPTHVVPLLMSCLPGIDPNDIKKTLVTLHFILIFSWMVPIVDCSSAPEHWPDLTEEELLTCESTAQFEDFVLLFLEKLFNIVESSVLENVRLESKESDSFRSKTESVMETALSSAATAVLMQCSPKIFKEALRKFKNFAMTNTFETKVAGSIIGVLLRIFARVDSEATLTAFIPELCDELNELLCTEEAVKEENPARELLYRLLLLSNIVECDGKILLKFIPSITTVLDKALKLHSKESIMLAADVLCYMMGSLSSVGTKEFRGSSKDYSKAPKEWLPIREWGQGCPLKEANIVWHTPCKEEVDCAQELLNKYGKPEILRLRQWLSGERDMCRKRRLRSFYIIKAVSCCNSLMPPPDEPAVELVDTLVPATNFPLVTGVTNFLHLEGENMRVYLTHLLLQVQAKLLEDKSDDTKGFEVLIQLWERVSGVKPTRSGPNLEMKMRSYAALERAMDGKAGPPGGGRIRSLLADAARLQAEARIDLQSDEGIGETGLAILNALYQLSVYSYTSVRMLSQVRLYWMLSHHAYSYRALIPKLAELLEQGGEGDEWHARHKGALFVMLGPRMGPVVAKQDWEVVRQLWPAILKAPLSEKPSIMKLESAFTETVHRQFPTVNTKLTLSPSSVESAKYFLSEKELNDSEFMEQLAKAEETENKNSERVEAMYLELLEDLVKIGEEPKVQWRRLELICQMLTYIPSLQTAYPYNVVRFILNSLLHSNIVVRKTAVRLVHFVLKQRKHKVKKILVDPYEVAGVEKPSVRIPGYRADNEWAMWSEERIPKTDKDWDKPWLRTTYIGFYAWPNKLEVAAPSSEQVSIHRDPATMDECERLIFEFFTNDDNITKLVSFLTVEEKKGKDKFSGSRFAMFRVLFRCFGPRVGYKFLAHALKHAADPQEASQRFAAEIVAAAVRAPRYWDRETALEFYDRAVFVLKLGLTAVTQETMEDWGTCVASAVENLDPNRAAPVLQCLLDLCTPAPTMSDDADAGQNVSFLTCARLYALQGVLGSMTWRTAPLAAELLERLDAAKFLQHPYQNVRESIGSILMTIFDTEITFPGGRRYPAPSIAEFLNNIKPKLSALYDEHGETVIKTSSSMISMQSSARESPQAATPEPEMRHGETLVAVSVARLSPDRHAADDSPTQGGTEQPDNTEGDSVAMLSRAGKSRCDRLENALRLCGDSVLPGPKEHARAVSLLTTVLRGCMGIIVRGINGATITQYELMRTACALSARGPPQPHDELGRAADGFLASLAMAHHSEPAFDVALKHLEDVASSKSWWARLACVEFAQPLLFYGLPLLCSKPERAVKAENFALMLMSDGRLEVRQTASKLLTGLMHCRALPNEDLTINQLMKTCRSKNLVERHSGVLGLCAYLSSRPYSLGPRIGEVLAELSRHTNAPDPIPSSIRKALADFRRTHQDDWPKHREALTEEELDLLADLTSPPSYCA